MNLLEQIYLDIITLPSHFLNNEKNAEYHLKYICPKCPPERRKLRDVNCCGECWWNTEWAKKNYEIPRHFGALNWIRQYLSLNTNLQKYRNTKQP